jgi:hypothetical protein
VGRITLTHEIDALLYPFLVRSVIGMLSESEPTLNKWTNPEANMFNVLACESQRLT